MTRAKEMRDLPLGLDVDASGRLTVGSIGTDTTLSGGQPALQVTGSSFNGYIAAVRRDTSVYSSGIILAKSRNSTADNFTILQDNDQIGGIIFIGDDGTDLDTYGATIQAEVNGTPAANNMPADLIFSTNPGTNTVTERMRILKGGNVGIGTNNPSGPLAVHGNSSNTDAEADLGLYNHFLNTNTNVNTGSAIVLGSNSNPGTAIYAQRIGSNNEHKMGFQTRNSSGSSTTRMTILGNGNVGIGTINPGTNLEVATAGNTFIYVKDTGSGSGIYLKAASSGAAEIQTGGGNNTLGFRASGQERLHITAAGKVGVIDSSNSNLTAKFTVNTPGAVHTSGYQEDITQLYTTNSSYLGRHYMNFFHDNNNRDASGHHTVWGMAFGYDNNTRGGIQYDHKGQERMTLWSSYGTMQFKLPATPSATKRADQITEDPALELKSNGNNLRPRQSAICLTLNANQSLTGNSQWVKVNLNQVIYQKGVSGAWDSSNTRYSCPETGLYLVTSAFQLEQNTSNVWRYIYPCINGATAATNGMNFADFTPTGVYDAWNHAVILRCSSGDYIEWKAIGSGGSNTIKGGTETSCSIYFMG